MPLERPKVSVVVPAYNSAGTLRRAVESVLCQTERDFEVLIVEDGSADGTLRVARGLEASDPRVRVLALPENGGQSRARNRGTEIARGEWIAVLDADDRYLPTRLETLLRRGEEHGADMVADNQVHVAGPAGTPVATGFPPSGGGRPIALADFIRHSDPGAEFSFGLLKPMIRLDFIRETGLSYREGTNFAEDFYHLMQFFDAGGRAYLVHEPLYEWTLPFNPVTRRWTTTGAGAWRYDYRAALEANAHFLGLLQESGKPELVALLRRRERQYRVMVHYLDAQRAWDERGDALGAFGAIAGHPGTWPLLAKRVAGRLRRAARGAGRAAPALLALFLGSATLAPDARAGARGPEGPGAQALCLAAIGAAERSMRLPPKLLGSIGAVESGRPDPATGKVAPWPWTINVAGTGYFFRTKPEAIAEVERHRAAGVQSIDVGCMQVNLLHHPDAFASLDQAFDPAANAGYAARFLTRLYGETNDWPKAAAAYHSRTPDLAAQYRQRVMAAWPLASLYAAPGGGAPARPEPPPVDPHGIYTPEFAARLRQDARDRAARAAAMRPEPPGDAGAAPVRRARAVRHADARR